MVHAEPGEHEKRSQGGEQTARGGSAAIAPSVIEALTVVVPDAAIERVGGLDRYSTAAALADRLGWPDHAVAVVATGTDFADAAVAVSVAVRVGSTVLLVRPDHLPEAVEDLLATMSPQGAVVVGGLDAVGPQTELAIVRQLPARVPAAI